MGKTLSPKTLSCILGYAEPDPQEKEVVEFLLEMLSLDNPALRENIICQILRHDPTGLGAGNPDGYKRRAGGGDPARSQKGQPVDAKSGAKIVFPDGEFSIEKKVKWACLVNEWSDRGELIYVAEVQVKSIIKQLRVDRDRQRANRKKNSKGRVSPEVSHTCWINAPGTKVVYKNVSLFPTIKNGSRFVKQFDDLNKLPFEDGTKWLRDDIKIFKFQNPVEEMVYG